MNYDMTGEEMLSATKASFAKFLADSPFKDSDARTKIAMEGSYLAGFSLAQEVIINTLSKKI